MIYLCLLCESGDLPFLVTCILLLTWLFGLHVCFCDLSGPLPHGTNSSIFLADQNLASCFLPLSFLWLAEVPQPTLFRHLLSHWVVTLYCGLKSAILTADLNFPLSPLLPLVSGCPTLLSILPSHWVVSIY